MKNILKKKSTLILPIILIVFSIICMSIGISLIVKRDKSNNIDNSQISQDKLNTLYETIDDYKKQVDKLLIDKSNLTNDVKVLNEKIKSDDIKITELINTRTSLQAKVDTLTITNNNNENAIENLNKEIISINNQIASLTEIGAQRDELVNNLSNQVLSLKSSVADLETINSKNYAIISSLQTEIETINYELNQLRRDRYSNQIKTIELNSKICKYEKTINTYSNFIYSLANDNNAVVVFELDGYVYDILLVNVGDEVTLSSPDLGTFMVFNGWLVDDTLVSSSKYVVNSSIRFVADITYRHTITFMNDDEVYDVQYANTSSDIVLPSAPVKEGYNFVGWTLNGVDIISDISSIEVNRDLTFIALWHTKSLSTYTWSEISNISNAGKASEMFVLGDTKDVVFSFDGKVRKMTVGIVNFGKDYFSSSSTASCLYSSIAGMTFCVLKSSDIVLPYLSSASYADANTPYKSSDIRLVLNDKLFASLPGELTNVIKPSYSSPHYNSLFYPADNLWLPCKADFLGEKAFSYFANNDTFPTIPTFSTDCNYYLLSDIPGTGFDRINGCVSAFSLDGSLLPDNAVTVNTPGLLCFCFCI